MKDITEIKSEVIDCIQQFNSSCSMHGIRCKYDFKNLNIKKNRYTCLIIKISFDNIKTKNIKEYSLIISKNVRNKTVFNTKIIRRLQNILESNLNYIVKTSFTKVKKNNLLDCFKYMFSYKYSYKKDILGLDINIIRFSIILLVALIFTVLSLIVRHSYFLEHGHYPLW